jgi:hypothetical protein
MSKARADPQNSLAMTARRAAETLCLLAAFAALTALFFRQALPDLSSALIGPPEDNLQDFWNSWYAVRSHTDGFFFTHLIRAPEGVSLIYHSFAYPQIFAVWLLGKIFGTDLSTLVLLQNLTNLASFPLAATGAYYLCRYLGGGRLGSAAGGFIFAFNPWHIAQVMHHAHVAGIEFLPLFALCYLLALDRKSYAWLAGAVAFYVLSALSCWYYLFYGFYFLAFHLLYLRVHEHRWPRGWRLAAPALCLAGTGLLLSPLALPMALNGFKDNAYQVGGNIFSADLLSYLAFPPTHIWARLSEGLYDSFTGNPWEAGVYLGLINLALLAWGFWRTEADARRVLWYALGGMIFFAVLASGDALHWRGQTLPIHMPSIVLSKLPFFANVRTPARAIVFVYLFLGIAVAMTLNTAMTRKRGLWAGGALAMALGLMLLDFFPGHIQTTPVRCSSFPALARDTDKDFAVLDMPFGYREQNFYMAQQICHGRPIAQGVVARQLTPTLADHLATHDFAQQRRQLAAAHVKYILLHHPKNGIFGWDTPIDGDPELYRRAYPVVADEAGLTILRVY